MTPSDEDIWHFQHSGYYVVPQTLPEELIARLNEATDRELVALREPIVWEKATDGNQMTFAAYQRFCSAIPYSWKQPPNLSCSTPWRLP